MGSRSKTPRRTLSGAHPGALAGNKKGGHLSVRAHNDKRVTVLLFAGSDMEIIFYDSEPVVFRRKSHVYHNRDMKNDYGAPIAKTVVPLGVSYGRGLPSDEFRLRIIDNLIICLKRTMAPHDIVAESSDLGSLISKTLEMLFKLANSTTEDADVLKEEILDARMRLFTRYVGLDKRRTQPNE
jgi:hypothetical protein